jgi:hypothetical protein
MPTLTLLCLNTEKLSFTLKMNPMADLLPEELESLFGSKIGIQRAQTTSKHSSLRTHDSNERHKVLPYYHSNFYPYVGGRNQAQKNELNLKSAPLPETLNWASGNNPIGNSVMSTVRNQVSGSCKYDWFSFFFFFGTSSFLRFIIGKLWRVLGLCSSCHH